MTSLASTLAKALPKPKYTGEHEELPSLSKGSRIIGPESFNETQLVLKVSPSLPKDSVAVITDLVAANWAPSLWIEIRMASKISGGLR